MKVQNHVRIGHSDKVFNVLVYILMSLILLLCAYPLYFVVIASFSDPAQVNIGNVVLFPKEIMFDGYAAGETTDLKTLQALAGHSTIQMTMDHYIHAQPEKIKELGNKIHNLFVQ